jgi:peptide/nickel transport system permease protein
MVAVLLLVGLGITYLVDLAPGDPGYAILGAEATPDQVAQVDAALHLNDPFFVRYWHWLTNLVHGDFGTSFITKQPVATTIAQSIPITAEIVVLAFLIGIVVSIPIGIFTAYRADGRFDRLWAGVSSALISAPPFVSALVLVYVTAILPRTQGVHLPVTGWVDLTQDPAQNLYHVLLPAVTLSLVLIPLYSRLLRADMLATLQEDFILAAKAKGLPTKRILFVHALRPSSFSILTLAGLSLGNLISGAAVIEVLFALPGLGQSIVNSISVRDIPTIQGIVMLIAIVYVVVNTLVDIAYRYLDPRIRLTGAAR